MGIEDMSARKPCPGRDWQRSGYIDGDIIWVWVWDDLRGGMRQLPVMRSDSAAIDGSDLAYLLGRPSGRLN